MKKATLNKNIHLPIVSSVAQRFVIMIFLDDEVSNVFELLFCPSLSIEETDDRDVGIVLIFSELLLLCLRRCFILITGGST